MPVISSSMQNDKDMKQIKKYIKRGIKWYFTKYMEFYRPMLDNNVNPFLI